MSDNPLSTETTNSIVNRAKAIIMTPKPEWAKIALEAKSPVEVLKTYALWLAAIGPIAALIGGQIFGYGFFGFSYRPGIGAALYTLVSSYVGGIIGLFIVAFIANFLSPRFGGKNDYGAAFRLVVYAYTPVWVAGILYLIPALSPIVLLAWLYAVYLFFVGVTPVTGVPADKAPTFTAATFGILIAIGVVLYLVLLPMIAVSALASYS